MGPYNSPGNEPLRSGVDNAPTESHSPESRASLDVLGVSRVRFVVMVVFALYGFINQVQYVAYATIVRATQEKFSVDALAVNLLSLLIPLVYCVGVLPGCWLYSRVGLRYGMIIGGSANALASVLKFVSVWVAEYPMVAVAQILVAVGQVLYLSLPPLLAACWFPVPERTAATAVCSLFGFLGMAVGLFYSPYVVRLPDKNGTGDWAALMGSQMGVAVLVLALMVLYVPERPTQRPSLTASRTELDPAIWSRLRCYVFNGNLMLLTGSFGLTTGCLASVAALLAQIVEPFGISESEAGIIAFSGLMAGAANCFLVGFLVDRFRRYKLPLLLLSGTATALLVPVAIVVKAGSSQRGHAVVAYVIIPLLEFLVLPMVPVTMELSVELTYPGSETLSSTLVLMSMCFVSFLFMTGFSFLLGDFPTTEDSFLLIVIVITTCAISFVGLCFVKEDRRRYQQECQLVALEHCPPECFAEDMVTENGERLHARVQAQD